MSAEQELHIDTDIEDVDLLPDLTVSGQWIDVPAHLLTPEEWAMHQNLKALADRQDQVFKSVLKMMDAIIDESLPKNSRTISGKGPTKSVLTHRFDGIVEENINQLADVVRQHQAAGNAIHLMQTKNAPKSATVYYETLKAQVDDDEHPLASALAELDGDEKAQTEFYVTVCRTMKSHDDNQDPAQQPSEIELAEA